MSKEEILEYLEFRINELNKDKFDKAIFRIEAIERYFRFI